jgi:hypothetical protein
VRLRQIALVARELEPVVQDLCAVLGVEVSFRDPGVAQFGLHNAVMPVGDTFLEVVSPIREDTAAGRWLARRGGDGGYMVIVQSDDLEADRARLGPLGVRVVWEIALPDIASLHLHPRDVGGAILSLDAARPSHSWRWAGPDWPGRVRTDVVRRIAGVELQAQEPAALAARWSEVLGRPAGVRGDAFEIALESGRIRFVPERDGRGEGLVALELEAVDRQRALAEARQRGLSEGPAGARIGGTRIRFA